MADRAGRARSVTLRRRLPEGQPFDLKLAAFGHGWIDLPPLRWDHAAPAFETVLEVGGAVADVKVQQDGDELVIALTSEGRLSAQQTRAAAQAVAHLLRLDEDFSALWRLCAGVPSLAWAAERGAGRLLRSPTVFEDLIKLLCTTNCSWAATRGMVSRLTEALGAAAPSGRRTFPSAEACAERDAAFYRDVIRVGYRAGALVRLARDFASGALDEAHFCAPELSAAERYERLLALPGFGPYAAGQALRLLGVYSELALDSWCRARYAKLHPRRRDVSDARIARDYARYGSLRGLVLWLDLTAEWHGEGQRATSDRPVLEALTSGSKR